MPIITEDFGRVLAIRIRTNSLLSFESVSKRPKVFIMGNNVLPTFEVPSIKKTKLTVITFYFPLSVLFLDCLFFEKRTGTLDVAEFGIQINPGVGNTSLGVSRVHSLDLHIFMRGLSLLNEACVPLHTAPCTVQVIQYSQKCCRLDIQG